ncbi:protein TILLER ANGLE CONTROL 1 isoform X1 [Hevea brasiliensis]|uniref:protein TILLER ANGLE CONTROL 1 isoform X1 n=1 Tax=Hevea brasiliensis TaxID=3981 RepID=UPI0025E52594|nr:protein TILLER ANGLE CONTROL 1 isoform X1 [Hevea brasiliensis]
MKIFNWVQRRFHHGALKDGLARNVKKAESITSEADKQALLKQVALVDVLDGWKGGILTIGTLGLDPLKPFNQQNEYFVLETEGEEEDDDDDYNDDEEEQQQYSVHSDDEDSNVNQDENEEENPLIFTRFEHNFEELATTFDANDAKSKIDPMENNLNIHDNDQRKRKGERITLAELFLADSDMKKKPESFELAPDSGKKPSVRAKNGLSFAKKLIPHVREDSRPIKKFHQLMRRMLKRKIHPELEGKAQKTDNQNKVAIMEVGIGKGNEADESVSLIPTPPRYIQVSYFIT